MLRGFDKAFFLLDDSYRSHWIYAWPCLNNCAVWWRQSACSTSTPGAQEERSECDDSWLGDVDIARTLTPPDDPSQQHDSSVGGMHTYAFDAVSASPVRQASAVA